MPIKVQKFPWFWNDLSKNSASNVDSAPTSSVWEKKMCVIRNSIFRSVHENVLKGPISLDMNTLKLHLMKIWDCKIIWFMIPLFSNVHYFCCLAECFSVKIRLREVSLQAECSCQKSSYIFSYWFSMRGKSCVHQSKIKKRA